MSDFHKMIVTVLKTTFPKAKPKIVSYRCYKYFDKTNFRRDLRKTLGTKIECRTNYAVFQQTFLTVLNTHAPMKNGL